MFAMTTFVLDTLTYTETLKAGGFSEQQAATQAHALAEIIDKQMATKSEVEIHENTLRRDIETLRLETKRDIEMLRLETKRDIEALRLDMKREIAETNTRIAETKAELTRWIIGAGLLQTTVIVAVLMKVAKLI
jgi:Flp pilus assembly secretin CpaC